MAWIRYYKRCAYALVAALVRVTIVRWDETPTSDIHGACDPFMPCCMASRVRRSTAATGE